MITGNVADETRCLPNLWTELKAGETDDFFAGTIDTFNALFVLCHLASGEVLKE
ncbi:MAG: hypothetical protein BSOLF_2068 [Candidatus Carbobacillus altaicus]|uniref:Uncharacterized protein n=1 Tax=Candidatus Carbonibacillus altaicus TaxID=2163959 RepID=A0A2R6Y3G4_9BACL|nr:MAG: hypothetical protein BSOLF_2068 [Candidatus Carbobacillus altaicus]